MGTMKDTSESIQARKMLCTDFVGERRITYNISEDLIVYVNVHKGFRSRRMQASKKVESDLRPVHFNETIQMCENHFDCRRYLTIVLKLQL